MEEFLSKTQNQRVIRLIHKEGNQMTDNHINKCPNSPIIRKIQIEMEFSPFEQKF